MRLYRNLFTLIFVRWALVSTPGGMRAEERAHGATSPWMITPPLSAQCSIRQTLGSLLGHICVRDAAGGYCTTGKGATIHSP